MKIFKRNFSTKSLNLALNSKTIPKENKFGSLKSLFYKFRNLEDLTKSEVEKINFTNLGAKDTPFCRSNMSPSDIEYIDNKATIKLQELEDSDLSKEDILSLKKEKISTVPLKMDSFFQKIKNSPEVRKIFLGIHSEYSIGSIISLALRQNVGVDTSSSGTGRRLKEEKTSFNDEEKYIFKKNSIKQKEIKDNFVSDTLPLPEDYKQTDYFGSFKPLRKFRQNKRPETKLNRLDVHWRNTELLTRFMTNIGTIKHSRLTGLSQKNQNLIARAIKVSRGMRLLPYTSNLNSYYKLSLTSIEEDMNLQDDYDINLSNGAIEKKRHSVCYPYNKSHYKGSLEEIERELLNEKTNKDDEIRKASKYITYLYKEEIINKNLSKNLSNTNPEKHLPMEDRLGYIPPEELKNYKDTFEKLKNEYYKFEEDDFINLIISEKSQDSKTIDSIVLSQIIEKDNYIFEYKEIEKLFYRLEELKKTINSQQCSLGEDFYKNKRERELFK